MGGFAFQVACLRLVANEPLFGVYAVPVDWPVLRQNLKVVESFCSTPDLLKTEMERIYSELLNNSYPKSSSTV